MVCRLHYIVAVIALMIGVAIASCDLHGSGTGGAPSSSCPPPGPDPFAVCAAAGTCDPLWYRPVTDDPCDWPAQCAGGLRCDYEAPPTNGAQGCGTCRSNGICDPMPSSPYACRNAGEPAPLPVCPPYIENGYQGTGCQWSAECPDGFICDLAKPQIDPGGAVIYCGSCEGPADGGIGWPFPVVAESLDVVDPELVPRRRRAGGP